MVSVPSLPGTSVSAPLRSALGFTLSSLARADVPASSVSAGGASGTPLAALALAAALVALADAVAAALLAAPAVVAALAVAVAAAGLAAPAEVAALVAALALADDFASAGLPD